MNLIQEPFVLLCVYWCIVCFQSYFCIESGEDGISGFSGMLGLVEMERVMVWMVRFLSC